MKFLPFTVELSVFFFFFLLNENSILTETRNFCCKQEKKPTYIEDLFDQLKSRLRQTLTDTK